MTIDETPRGPGSGGESHGMGRSRTTARDLERYAGLFARRTQGMKSSAMRDLMAITARPDVISLAGGLPDTSTFPAEDAGRADGARRGRRIRTRAPVRAHRGDGRAQGVHRRGDGGGGHGRRRGRPARDHRRPAGDRSRLQDADRPRRRDRRGRARPTPAPFRRSAPTRPTSCRSRWTPTACAWTCSSRRSTGSGAKAARRSSSTPCRRSRTRPASRCRWSAAAGWSASPRSASCWCSRTTRTACCATRASRCRRSTRSTAAST